MLKLFALLMVLLPMTSPAQMTHSPAQDEAEIRAARVFSNRSIARRNLLGVGSSLDEDFVAVTGDGSFVASRAAYLKLFKQDFDSLKNSLRYERITDTVEISSAKPLAAEHGHWIGTRADGSVAYTGTYSAVWRHGSEGWKIRSEMYVTLAAQEAGGGSGQ
jgi:ketosteroid isomerase-like protein